MDTMNDKFYYVRSCSLPFKIQIKIGSLEGKQNKPEYDKLVGDPLLKFSGLYQNICSDLMICCQIFDHGIPLGLPITTSYKSFTARWNWNEWLTFPVQFNDLPRFSILALTIYDCAGPQNLRIVGGTTIPLFSKYGLFRQGMLDLRVWPNKKADVNFPFSTAGKIKDMGKEQTQSLSKLSKKHRNGHITKVDWLDRLTFRELEQINEKEKRSSDYLYLMIEFQSLVIDGISHHIIYFENINEETHPYCDQSSIVLVPDQEVLKENLVENKHHKLARSLRSGHCDKDAKPNSTIRDWLHRIVHYPPTKPLTIEEQDHVWKFRFFLKSQKQGLAKFLKCVNWNQINEVRQAVHMMSSWAPMDVGDALELLSSNFTHAAVRKYAVVRLQVASDDDILLYLLQLVQALKYEDFKVIRKGFERLSPSKDSSSDDDVKEHFLEKKDSKESNSTLTNESTTTYEVTSYPSDQASSSSATETELSEVQNLNLPDAKALERLLCENDSLIDLASFLIERASKNLTLANYFYWYLLIECEDQESAIKQDIEVREMYLTVMKTFTQVLAKGTSEMQNIRHILSKQQKFIDKLVKLIKLVSRERGDRKKKIEKLRQLLADPDTAKFNFTNFEPIPFPLNPKVLIKGIATEKSSLFKSALMPSKLYFITTEGTEYVAIFKHGDDLRQDQLILQMITLMDKLLLAENMNLKLTPYGVLATSTRHGFVEFIESVTVAEALANEGSIQNYFRKYHPSESGPYGIAPEIMKTYVRSCAGYCVITYILGVGDRHMDNILLTPCGKLFHIDFGYILGRDPKPLPPPMRLSKEMIEGMGGVTSEHYQEFRNVAHTAFLHLRRKASLMLNLFSLMTGASIPDIALEPDKTVRKVLDNLRLEINEEEAVQFILYLIDSSASAVMPVIVEQFHKFTQLIRK